MVPFKISHFFSPKHLLSWRWILWKSQYFSPEKLKVLQTKLSLKIINHCFDDVPYYQNLFANLGLKKTHFRTLDDIKHIPIINKEILIQHHEEFKANNFQKYKPHEIQTSGTTGTPLTVFWDLSSNIIELVSMWRHFSWAGYHLGEPILDIRSLTSKGTLDYTWNWRCRTLEVSSDNINDDNVYAYAEILRKYRIALWRGHPSSLVSLCQIFKKHHIDDIKPKYIFPVSETLYPNQRSIIEAWTHVPLCDGYGLKEHCALINQCPEGGYHIASEYGYIEIIKDNGLAAQPGEKGRIVATGFHNKAFPLLRYDTNDYATKSETLCSCGRTLPLIEKLTGRRDDPILNNRGKWVSGLHFSFFSLKGIKKAQVIQREVNSIDVYVIPTEDYSLQTQIQLLKNLKDKLGQDMTIHLHQVDDIAVKSNEKFRFVINKLRNAALT